jgi:hypothetical protein
MTSLAFGVDIERSIGEGELEVSEAQLSVKELEALRMRQRMGNHRIKGDLSLAVPANSFEGSRALIEFYPKDEQGWRWIPVELRDTSFTNIGDKTNDLLLKQALLRVNESSKDN